MRKTKKMRMMSKEVGKGPLYSGTVCWRNSPVSERIRLVSYRIQIRASLKMFLELLERSVCGADGFLDVLRAVGGGKEGRFELGRG